MCSRLVSLQTKTNSELMVMEVVVQEEVTLRLMILLSFCVISQNLQLFAFRSVRLTGTQTHAKTRRAPGAAAAGALFDHLIL